jgi:hypothetical protein
MKRLPLLVLAALLVVEVYDPKPGVALAAARSGRITLIS